MTTVKLGVNIDHVATLREARKEKYPSILGAMRVCEMGGADQITVHLREDRRHIQDQDVVDLIKESDLPINMEMAFTSEMVRKAMDWKPFAVTLVPEKREEMTTESGLDLLGLQKDPKLFCDFSKSLSVYGFIEADKKQIEFAKEFGLKGVEFHTGPFAHAYKGSKDSKSDFLENEVERLFAAAEYAQSLNLEVKAGHGLTLENLSYLGGMPGLSEVNIGHSIVARALFIGLEQAVAEMKALLIRF